MGLIGRKMTRKRNNVKTTTLLLTGDHFEIGRNLGKYWGNYFAKMDKEDKWDYQQWLTNDKIKERNVGLLRNMGDHFPALFHELIGMNIGINESKVGFKTSLYGLFECWLAECDLSFTEYNRCSSVILPIKNGFFLAHSDENEKRYPLLVANVSLKTADSTIQFISISHPFQLLGSAAGMTRNFAFQGNSIGCRRDIFYKLFETWPKRIPKDGFHSDDARDVKYRRNQSLISEIFVHPSKPPLCGI